MDRFVCVLYFHTPSVLRFPAIYIYSLLDWNKHWQYEPRRYIYMREKVGHVGQIYNPKPKLIHPTPGVCSTGKDLTQEIKSATSSKRSEG